MLWTWMIALIIGTSLITLGLLFRRRIPAGGAAKPSEPCWVCGHGGLEEVARAAYHCSACGNVQGRHAIAYRNAQRRAAYVALSLSEAIDSHGMERAADVSGPQESLERGSSSGR